KHTRPTSSAGLTVTDAAGNQHTFTGASIKGGGDHNLHPDVQAAYDRVPQDIRLPGNQHSRCGEAEALTNALNAGVDPRGGTMAAVNVRAEGNPRHGEIKPVCDSCQHVLDQFGINGLGQP
ncbi:YwqJ-related putative deaminase, partial [Streptomyces triticirhizae]